MIDQKSIMTRLLLLIAMMSSVVFSPVGLVQAEEADEPLALVQNSTERMLKALKDNEAQLAEDSSAIYALVEEILMPNFDFDKMSKLALGKNWRKADSEQRVRFTEEFRLLLVRTYSTAMLEYTNEEVLFLPFRDDLAKKKVKVDMEILQPGGPSIPMSLSMYLNAENGWKVYDVKIDGISLVTNYRSTFSTEIRNKGMNELIERLASRNEKVKT